MAANSQIQPILVTGSHRSGSTWVGQVLSQAQGLGYMHEPFNPIYPSVKKAPIDIWYLYVAEHNSPQYKDYFTHVLHWNFKGFERLFGINNFYEAKMWLKYAGIYAFNKLQGKVPLMKDPIAFFSAPWLAKTFDMQVVALIRHPAAFVYSLKRKDWHFPFHHLLQQEALMQDYLQEFRTEIEEFSHYKKDIIAQACLIWRILYGTLGKFQTAFLHWHFIKHEDLSLNPVGEFESLFAKLGLTFTPEIAHYVVESSKAENPGGTVGNEEQLQRDSAANTKYWKQKMSVEEIERVKDLTYDIWPAFYNESHW